MSNTTLIDILPDPNLDLTQIITVVTAGSPVQGPNIYNVSGWYLKASPSNTGIIYYMFHGQTAEAKGFPLNPGDLIFIPVTNLNSLDFDASSNNQKVHASKE